jgi:ADP-ribose pyrophosphatase YjhB (NUDIX family)
VTDVQPDLPRHSVSVSAAIIDDRGRFLVIQRADNGHWEPPGGVLELGESIHDGLVREVLEETGYRVRPVGLTGVYKNVARGIVALVFRGEVLGGREQPGEEVRRLGWLTPEEIDTVMFEAYAARMRDALELGPPHVRAHDGTRLLEAARDPTD